MIIIRLFRYILPEKERQLNLSHVSEEDKIKLNADTNNDERDHHQAKRPKLSFDEKKKLRGQNKSRGPTYARDTTKELCTRIMETEDQKCLRDNCSFLHNVEEYVKIKPEDISSTCYNFETSGKCLRGVTCRFGTAHLTSDGKNIVDEEKFKKYQENGPYTRNILSNDLKDCLRKKKYNFDLFEKIIKHNDSLRENKVN